jgi:hypothetical protein
MYTTMCGYVRGRHFCYARGRYDGRSVCLKQVRFERSVDSDVYQIVSILFVAAVHDRCLWEAVRRAVYFVFVDEENITVRLVTR